MSLFPCLCNPHVLTYYVTHYNLFNFVNCETNIFHRDAGKDPYWDFKRGRRKKIGEDGCEDDGGYEDLFRKDQADEVEHADELLAKSRRR